MKRQTQNISECEGQLSAPWWVLRRNVL